MKFVRTDCNYFPLVQVLYFFWPFHCFFWFNCTVKSPSHVWLQKQGTYSQHGRLTYNLTLSTFIRSNWAAGSDTRSRVIPIAVSLINPPDKNPIMIEIGSSTSLPGRHSFPRPNWNMATKFNFFLNRGQRGSSALLLLLLLLLEYTRSTMCSCMGRLAARSSHFPFPFFLPGPLNTPPGYYVLPDLLLRDSNAISVNFLALPASI